MGILRVIVDRQARDLHLSPSSRIGRHWSCDFVIPVATAPLYWLELRWRDDHWAWRPLSGEDRTRGTGGPEPGEFRSWAGRNGRARLDGCACEIEALLVDPAPPEVLVEEICTYARVRGPELEGIVEMWSDGRVWALGSDPAVDAPLADGSAFVLDGRSWRLHLPRERFDTTPARIDVGTRTLQLTIELPILRATLFGAHREAVVSGECVRVLAVYAAARVEDGRSGGGGWIGAPAAWESWVELGGRSRSPIDRLAWERGKLRSRLAAQGVGGLEHLFETRGVAGSTEVRLALAPEHIAIESDVAPR